ncbi:MAG: RiPP maturation radical SAM protein 1 [bacterium]|nr:RiPP maturation radical SAM protein 1 [bacterium]
MLVSMPFGSLTLPAIGPELLKGSLVDRRVGIRYFTLSFARRIGPHLYEDVAYRFFPERSLVGEWIFSAALHGDPPLSDDDGFFEEVVLKEAGKPVPAEKLDELLRARREVEAFLADCRRQIERYRPRIVGFTSTFQQHIASLALARRLKAHHPELFIVFGGANCEGTMGLETVRRFPFVDAVVSGEADLVFPTLVERILDGRRIDDLQGICTREHDDRRLPNAPRVTDLDALPRPDYDDYLEQWRQAALEFDQAPRLLLETSRGCWWGERRQCTFCGFNGSSMGFRSKSATRALDELIALVGRYPGLRVMVVDSILDMRYFRDFLPALAKANLDVELVYEVKANLRKDQVRLLRDAGVRNIVPGIESLSDTVLGLMRKGVRALRNIQLLKWCAELGVSPFWLFLYGFPQEPPEEYRRMAERIPLLTHLPPPKAANRIRLDRYSPNFEQAETLGLTAVEPCPAYRHVYRLPHQALMNLAYTFDYSHRDGRDVTSYTREVTERIREWQKVSADSKLYYAEQGEHLLLWDLRPAASRLLTRLSGLARSFYLACDEIRSISWLARHGTQSAGSEVPKSRVEDIVGPLVEQGLMIRDDDRVLSLAVAGKPQGTDQERTQA